MLYIVASMDDELTALRQQLDALPPQGAPNFPVQTRTLAVGPRRAGTAMAETLSRARPKPHAALMLGIAGALEPGMKTGQLILAQSYLIDAPNTPQPPITPHPDLLTAAEAAAHDAQMPPHRAPSLTVNHLVCDAQERQQLRQKYGAASVNMEDHAVAAAAQHAGIPFLSARVILDTAEQQLPGYLPALSPNPSAILTQIIAQPWRIPTLRRLKSQMQQCQTALAQFALAYLPREAERRQSARQKASREAIY